MDEIALLEGLVSIPSLSGQEDEAVEWVMAQCAAAGMAVQRDPAGNGVCVAGDPQALRNVVLLGHIDTVPGWIPVRQKNGVLQGRGTVDAKGPLATFIAATMRWLRDGGAADARVTVIAGVGEEARSPGAHYLEKNMAPPTYCVIGEPSGWEGITLGYKGTLRAEYSLFDGNRHRASGKPSPTETAVAYWNRVTAYAAERNGGRSWAFDTLDPALRSMKTVADGLRQGVEMSLEMRLPVGINEDELRHLLRGWSDGAEISFPYVEHPFRSEKNTPLVRAMLQGVRKAGGTPRFKLKTGTADMCIVGPAWKCPIVAYGPGDSTLDHTPDEQIELEEYRRAVDALHHALHVLTG